MSSVLASKNLLPGVSVTLGEIRVSSIQQVTNSADAKVFYIDTDSKYAEAISGGGAQFVLDAHTDTVLAGHFVPDDFTVDLYAGKSTLRLSEDPARKGKFTTFTFDKSLFPVGKDFTEHGTPWHMIVDASRYTVIVAFYRWNGNDENSANIE